MTRHDYRPGEGPARGCAVAVVFSGAIVLLVAAVAILAG